MRHRQVDSIILMVLVYPYESQFDCALVYIQFVLQILLQLISNEFSLSTTYKDSSFVYTLPPDLAVA